MLSFILENLATIIIGAAVLALVVIVAATMIRDKRKGAVCGCSGCSGCAYSQSCSGHHCCGNTQ